MGRLPNRSELEGRERELKKVLDQKNSHGIDTVRRAIANGVQMGIQQIPTSFLDDHEVSSAIRNEVSKGGSYYIAITKADLRQALLKRLRPFKEDKNATVSSQTVKEINLASATLGHLRDRKHLIP